MPYTDAVLESATKVLKMSPMVCTWGGAGCIKNGPPYNLVMVDKNSYP